uniref:Olfactory receptor n=1 Tax=Sphaeramia orbicularis TaxID=375764 RepID=A0A673BWU5_9TELE
MEKQMDNRTALTFKMTAYAPLYFLLFLIIYIIIIAESSLLIGVVYHEKSLHEPMYLLLCNLAVNGLFGGTALLPAVLSNVLSDSHEISLSLCQIQIYAIHTYAITEFTILAVMSYDRYVAICYPLSYHVIMSQRLVKLIVCMWLYPMLAFLIVLCFTLQLKFCKKAIDKIYCLNYLLVQLSCTKSPITNIIGLFSVAIYTLPQLFMVFYSYAHILKICLLSFNNSKRKALQTCIPHLLSIINYSIGCFFEIAQGRFNITYISYHTKLFLSLYFLICPPMFNPLIYGLSIQVIRVRLLKLFRRQSRQVQVM